MIVGSGALLGRYCIREIVSHFKPETELFLYCVCVIEPSLLNTAVLPLNRSEASIAPPESCFHSTAVFPLQSPINPDLTSFVRPCAVDENTSSPASRVRLNGE